MKIKIKKKNQGKFTKAAKAAGESVQEHAHSVLNNSKATLTVSISKYFGLVNSV